MQDETLAAGSEQDVVARQRRTGAGAFEQSWIAPRIPAVQRKQIGRRIENRGQDGLHAGSVPPVSAAG